MSFSPPPSNLLLDPLSELTAALRLNAFGLDPATTQILLESTFPITEEDKQRVAVETVRSGVIGEAVQGRARVGLAGGEGEIVVVLDRRGYTLLEATTTTGKTYPNQTFESLEALLISSSPGYVQAMTQEIERRFAQHDYGAADEEEDATAVGDAGDGGEKSSTAGKAEEEGK